MKNEKIKVTSLEIIVTGKREKPYFEIKYKEVGKRDYKIGYSSYDLNNVFAWRDECFEVVNHKRNIFQRLFMDSKNWNLVLNSRFYLEVEYIKYTDELIDAVNKYNDNLESIAQKILNLKIGFNNKDIEVRNLYGLLQKLSVINNVKSRKTTEQLLQNIITEYGIMLEDFRDTGKLP